MGIIRWVSFKKISRLSGGKMGKKTILVVDDAKENINILGELLKEDYNVRAAINGEKALVIAASENKPDLILLDVVMPGMDGHEVCKRLKADITTKDIPIIFITGKSDEKDELTGFEIGAVDYVTKPFNPVVVKARVKTHLDLKSNRDLLEEKNRELNKINYNITESIKYAKLIQESILPHTEVVLNENRFVIWRPRDLVGGDFYWHKKCNNGDLFGVIDCTGHGVPGAVMSIMVKTIIDRSAEYISEDINLSEILKNVNITIKKTLNKENADMAADDGADAGIIYIDNVMKYVKFAGAKISLFKVSANGVEEIKGDKQSLGYIRSKEDYLYTENRFDFEKDTVFYITTDGFIDQNGGENDFSFGKRNFADLLSSIYKKSMVEQKKDIENRIAEYMGNEGQRDDITVMGFKI